MPTNSELIHHFYDCFSRRDYAGMNACYAPDARFDDPVFTLRGPAVKAMWHMLCEGSKDLQLTYRDVVADEQSGRAHWEATYTFSSSGRRVHNVIDAAFVLRNGQIVQHHDHFSFWRWSRQALGLPGLALGWTPLLHARVQRTAQARLNRFIAAHAAYQPLAS